MAIQQRYVEVEAAAFPDELLPGKDLHPAQLRKIGKLKGYNATGNKDDMHPPLVSRRTTCTPA